MVDSHCHLDIADGDDWFSTDEALAAAADVGVTRIVQIGCDLPGARWAVQAAASYDPVAGVALHPNEAPRHAEAGILVEALAEIEALARTHDKVRAVGETDWTTSGPVRTGGRPRWSRSAGTSTWRNGSTRPWSSTTGTPTRRCSQSSAEGAPERWVMHCFSGDEGSPGAAWTAGPTSASPGP